MQFGCHRMSGLCLAQVVMNDMILASSCCQSSIILHPGQTDA